MIIICCGIHLSYGDIGDYFNPKHPNDPFQVLYRMENNINLKTQIQNYNNKHGINVPNHQNRENQISVANNKRRNNIAISAVFNFFFFLLCSFQFILIYSIHFI